ncbi:UDP-galactopyranose mutase [Trichostrongylus colubriformis]|uniref:UDP-galactopyranose mutase n=1 Tax=Trichostrongylus colubriformis TaxID=6319 RepID=A0AAN8F1I9_TRICO
MEGKSFVIIGSGPTALGATYRLYELIQEGTLPESTQVTVIEKEIEVGGLARSVTDRRGFTWDLGVHVTGHSKYPKFTYLINRAVRHWNNVPRCVKAYMRHVIQDDDNVEANYVPYPVQDSIPYFPENVKLRCLNEISSLSAPSRAAENFDEFTANTFGETLQAIFIRPYNEKVWTVPLHEMNCVWAENRVPRASIEDLTRRCRLSRDELDEEDNAKTKSVFRYPRDCRGIGDVWKTIASELPSHWFYFGAPVIKIDTKSKKIHSGDGKSIDYDYVISTMPIVELGKITSLCPKINLSHSKVTLVGIGMRRPQPEFTEKLSWLYFPQPDIIFYRCTFMSNFNERLTPNAVLFWSVLVEIGMGSDEHVDENAVINCTIRDLMEHGIIYPTSRIESTWLHVLPYGYPIPTLNRDDELQKAQKVFERENIYSRGRFGSWRYEAANQDHSFTMGTEVIDRIVCGTEETV